MKTDRMVMKAKAVKKQRGEVFHIIGRAGHNMENKPILRAFYTAKDGRIKLLKEEPYKGAEW